MMQSRLQRVNFVGGLIGQLKASIQPHLLRSLSVVGKATL
jgi:hypothetical protein